MLAWIGKAAVVIIVAVAFWVVIVQPVLGAMGVVIDITGPWGNGRVGE